MASIAQSVFDRLAPLVGLKLALVRRAADLLNFQFGQVRNLDGSMCGEYALHIQCPWRLEGPVGTVTGRCDLWEPDSKNQADWNFDIDPNLHDKLLGRLFGSSNWKTCSFENRRDDLVVEEVCADNFAGLTIRLSGGYRLVLFPAGTCGEDWRFFQPGSVEPHFVIAGGKLEPD